MYALDTAHLGHGTRHGEAIQSIAVEIGDRAAGSAHKMVMVFHVRIEAGSLAYGRDACDDSLGFQHPECAIDRIEGNGRNPAQYATVDGFGIGMLGCTDQLAQYLDTLMGRLDTVPAAGVHVSGQAITCFGAFQIVIS